MRSSARLKEKGPEIDLVEVMAGPGTARPRDPRFCCAFPDILDHRIEQIFSCFEKAAKEYEFKGKHFNVYPIKVNQQRPVLEEIVAHGKKFNIGLEAGSKPELHAVLAIQDNPESLIICNGYKDEDFIELALAGPEDGQAASSWWWRSSTNSPSSRASRATLNVRPNIGLRIKLSSSGSRQVGRIGRLPEQVRTERVGTDRGRSKSRPTKA